MESKIIDQKIRDCGYSLPDFLYIAICRSAQVDHVRRDGAWYDIWTTDGWHWRVTVHPTKKKEMTNED